MLVEKSKRISFESNHQKSKSNCFNTFNSRHNSELEDMAQEIAMVNIVRMKSKLLIEIVFKRT